MLKKSGRGENMQQRRENKQVTFWKTRMRRQRSKTSTQWNCEFKILYPGKNHASETKCEQNNL